MVSSKSGRVQGEIRPQTLRCAKDQVGDSCLGDSQIRRSTRCIRPTSSRSRLPTGSMTIRVGAFRARTFRPSVRPAGGYPGGVGTTPRATSSAREWDRLDLAPGGIQYVFARDPKLDVTKYRPQDHWKRIIGSRLMDSTNPDLIEIRGARRQLIMLEHMADYAQSPYAGIRYFGNVQRTLGKSRTARFARLYTPRRGRPRRVGAPATSTCSARWSIGEERQSAGISSSQRKWRRRRFRPCGRCLCAVAGMAALQVRRREQRRQFPARNSAGSSRDEHERADQAAPDRSGNLHSLQYVRRDLSVDAIVHDSNNYVVDVTKCNLCMDCIRPARQVPSTIGGSSPRLIRSTSSFHGASCPSAGDSAG